MTLAFHTWSNGTGTAACKTGITRVVMSNDYLVDLLF